MPIIKLFANLRKLAGKTEIEVSAPTLQTALNELLVLHPALAERLLENGQVRAHVIITLNGQLNTPLDTALKPADVIAIFPPIAGG